MGGRGSVWLRMRTRTCAALPTAIHCPTCQAAGWQASGPRHLTASTPHTLCRGVDNYGDANTPVFGGQIAAFQGHHQR